MHTPLLIQTHLGILSLDARMDNHIITWNPVDRSRDLVLVTSDQGVDDTENFGGVAAGGGRVGQDETDGLGGVDYED